MARARTGGGGTQGRTGDAANERHLRRDVRGVPRQHAYTLSRARKEALLGAIHVDDICSTIGNVARIAAVVELHEALAACEAAEAGSLELVLLDPHRKPASPRENLQNRKVLEAFVQFRWHIEAIQREFDDCKSPARTYEDPAHDVSPRPEV